MIIDKVNPSDMPSRLIDPESKRLIEQGKSLISSKDLIKRYRQQGVTLWITGLHGSGKNLLAYSLEKQLFDAGATVVMVDGSTTRSGLNRELDFSPAGRAEQMRRVAHVCRILNDQGIITICSFISPREHVRRQLAEIIGSDRFHLLYMDASIDYCQQNKPELYKLAESGNLHFLPGVDEPYEVPENPALSLKPDNMTENIARVMEYLRSNKVFPLGPDA
jgi:bifunctional enzyme CysN/CysC